MSQNTSSAVMAQRHEPHNSLDDFPTPKWGTRALMEHLGLPPETRIWEPACNRGYMADALREYCSTVIASDIHDYGVFAETRDFLFPGHAYDVDWIITNPPYRLSAQFAHRAMGIAKQGVALFARTSWIEGQDRFNTLFNPYRPACVLQFTERVLLLKGRMAALGGIDPLTGKATATATAYCWVIWRAPYDAPIDTHLRWIPPCRKRLERPEDYDRRPT
jgi:hypothetical protein